MPDSVNKIMGEEMFNGITVCGRFLPAIGAVIMCNWSSTIQAIWRHGTTIFLRRGF